MKRFFLIFVAAILVLSLASCNKKDDTKYAKNGLEYAVNEDGETCTVVGMGNCTDTVVEVPEKIGKYKVTIIGNEAFCAERYAACKELFEVILPEGVISIKAGAFATDEKLTSVNIPSTVTEIGAHAFEYCQKLNGITLPNGLSEIGSQTFMGCASLESISLPEGIKKIGTAAFHGCEKLEGITLPESIEEIGDSAFATSGIRYARVGAKLRSVGEFAFSFCDNLKDFYYAGTLAQWSSIDLGGDWTDSQGTFHAADGDVQMSDVYGN